MILERDHSFVKETYLLCNKWKKEIFYIQQSITQYSTDYTRMIYNVLYYVVLTLTIFTSTNIHIIDMVSLHMSLLSYRLYHWSYHGI